MTEASTVQKDLRALFGALGDGPGKQWLSNLSIKGTGMIQRGKVRNEQRRACSGLLSMKTQADKRCRADAASRHPNWKFATNKAICSWQLEKVWRAVCTCDWRWCCIMYAQC